MEWNEFLQPKTKNRVLAEEKVDRSTVKKEKYSHLCPDPTTIERKTRPSTVLFRIFCFFYPVASINSSHYIILQNNTARTSFMVSNTTHISQLLCMDTSFNYVSLIDQVPNNNYWSMKPIVLPRAGPRCIIFQRYNHKCEDFWSGDVA